MSLFDGSETNEIVIDPNKDYETELVGEGKKYKTNKDLARSRMEADAHIARIEREKKELLADFMKEREENVARARLEEIVNQLQTRMANGSSNELPEVKDEETANAFDPNKIDELISSRLTAAKQKEKEEANEAIVVGKLKEQFGSNYLTILKNHVDDLGLDQNDINLLARKSPKAFFKTLGLEEKSQSDSFSPPPRSQLRNDSFAPKTNERTWSWWQDVRKNKPDYYHSKEGSVLRSNDAVTLGSAFRDGDYSKI